MVLLTKRQSARYSTGPISAATALAHQLTQALLCAKTRRFYTICAYITPIVLTRLTGIVTRTSNTRAINNRTNNLSAAV
jgi:hypothetical protein